MVPIQDLCFSYLRLRYLSNFPVVRLIESNTTLRERRGNPIRVSKICYIHDEACRVVDVANLGHDDGIPKSLPQCGVYFSHSCQKMCKICLKRPLDATFLDCLALTFCDFIGELLPEWACLTLQGGTTFLLTSKLADIPVSRVRTRGLTQA